ncbi:hypothetical protein AAG747_09430 [Rapidithrix thailandica]|uniref:Uncharacterized protein n=1 Tax=Rapidithrix thailandica TaxID=413964 RepID=A0AAW9S4X3_9BACT
MKTNNSQMGKKVSKPNQSLLFVKIQRMGASPASLIGSGQIRPFGLQVTLPNELYFGMPEESTNLKEEAMRSVHFNQN